MHKETVSTRKAPAAIGPYSQATATGPLVFCSGQLGLNPETGSIVSGGIAAETTQALDNLSAILEAAGSDRTHVLKTTVFLTDLSQFPAMNGVYESYFPDTPPARSTVQVAALPKGGCVEIEAIAVRKTADSSKV